jgi:transposase-like protein
MTEETKDTSGPARISDTAYTEMVKLYERGDAGISELAEKFKVSRQSIYKRFKSDGIEKGSKSSVVEAEKIVESFVDRRSAWIEETRFQGYQALRQVQLMARKVAIDAQKAGARVGTVDDDMKTLGRLHKILCDNVLVSLKVLRADEHIDEDNLPTLTIEDLTSEEILDHHKLTGAMDESATIEDMLRENLEEED